MYVRYEFTTPETMMITSGTMMASKHHPYWVVGTSWRGDEVIGKKVVCYLPEGEDLLYYWPKAHTVTSCKVEKIEYTDDLPKPNWVDYSDEFEGGLKC